MFKLKSESAQATLSLGRILSKALKSEDVVILEGALGGGKTTFVKGILKGLGFRQRVLSPSFTLLRQYRLRNLAVCHFDLYRLESDEIFGLGLDDFLYSNDTITLIEWGGKLERELERYVRIEFLFAGLNLRQLKFSIRGYPKAKLSSLKKAYKV